MTKEIRGLSLIWIIITLFIAFIAKESIPNNILGEMYMSSDDLEYHRKRYQINENHVFKIALSIGFGSLAIYLTTKIPTFRFARFNTTIFVLSVWIGITMGYLNGKEEFVFRSFRNEVLFNVSSFQYSILAGVGLIALIYAKNIYQAGKMEEKTKNIQ